MNNWARYFGTPSDAATTVYNAGGLSVVIDKCGDECPYYSARCLCVAGECPYDKYSGILEWMMEECDER